ncbi:MAG: polymer-forming cytoskeletal protein, partial [Lachnospiraceae bacterium]|nr:polymer-forming cytoskeletal protein [Lachnospiraceae bacterium]
SGDITGNIKAKDLYAKDSFIVGQIECEQGATVRENTVILGDIKAENLVIDGAIQGKIDIRDNITIGEKAIVDSDIKAKTIQVNNGAAINGHCSLCYADINLGDIFPVTEEVKVPEQPEEDKQLKAAVKPKAIVKPKAVKKADVE